MVEPPCCKGAALSCFSWSCSRCSMPSSSTLGLLLLGAGHLNAGDIDAALRLQIARELHRLTRVLFQSAEVLIIDRVYFPPCHKHVLRAALDAGNRAIVIAHRLTTMLSGALVLCATIAIADLAGPGLRGETRSCK